MASARLRRASLGPARHLDNALLGYADSMPRAR